jgi:hypothetical protein
MRFVFAVLALFLLPGAAAAAWDSMLLVCSSETLWLPLLVGLGAGTLLTWLIHRFLPVVETFEHELTHALTALLFFRRIRSFKVTARKGGLVSYSQGFGGEFGNLMITIAPYFLPTFSVIAILFRPLLNEPALFWYDVFIGTTLVFHFTGTFMETKQNWGSRTFRDAGGGRSKTDIRTVGYITSVLAIASFTLCTYGLLLSLLGGGYHGAWHFCKSVILNSAHAYQSLFFLIRDITITTLLPLVKRLFG